MKSVVLLLLSPWYSKDTVSDFVNSDSYQEAFQRLLRDLKAEERGPKVTSLSPSWRLNPRLSYRTMPNRMRTAILALSLLLVRPSLATERIKVRVIGRNGSTTDRSHTLPATVDSTAKTDVDCSLYPNSANCTATTRTTSTVNPARQISYSVQGTTFVLQLPDNRVAVVTCDSKYQLRGDYINRRSCRAPLVDEIEGEFKKDNAKLFWTVSLDGKKMQSETYRIISIRQKP
jgi:hypothetical protein